MDKKKILILATATLVFMSLIGWVIIWYFQDRSMADQLLGPSPWYYQVGLGIVYGTLAALAGWQIVKLPQLNEIKKFFSGLIGNLQLTKLEVIYISICAGTGEEILFRGGIQPYLGIWFTSILFVLLHGYLNPKNIPITFYGIYMVIIIAGIGFMAINNGLISSIMAHIVIDLILITLLQSSFKKDLN